MPVGCPYLEVYVNLTYEYSPRTERVNGFLEGRHNFNLGLLDYMSNF